MTPAVPRYAPFVNVFVPFALLLTAGNILAEMSANLAFGRVVYSIQLAVVFALPAVVLFLLRELTTASPLYFRYWQLFWAFGFVGYALHFHYSVGVWFGWDFAQIHRRQGTVVLFTNCLLLAVWAVDVAIAVFRGQGAGGTAGCVIRWAAHVLFVIAFVTASVVFRSDGRTVASLLLGVALAVVAAVSFGLRWWK